MADETYPQELRYYKKNDGCASMVKTRSSGVTSFAQDALGEIVYAELPAIGGEVTAGQTYGELESVKAVSDLYRRSPARSWRSTTPCSTSRSGSTSTATARAGSSASA